MTIFEIITSIGIPSILLGFIYIGRKLQILDNLQKDVEKIWNEISKHKNGLSKHGEDIEGLKGYIGYGISKSPTIPSEKGKKFLEEAGFYKIYPELKERIFKLMDSFRPRTLYDYEKGAEESLKQLQEDPLIDDLKNYAVNHPDESLELIFKVASWVIRDDYEKYKSGK